MEIVLGKCIREDSVGECRGKCLRGMLGCRPGVTGQNIPPAGLYSGLKRPRLDYTRICYGLYAKLYPGVYYGLGQFIFPQAKSYLHDVNTDNSV